MSDLDQLIAAVKDGSLDEDTSENAAVWWRALGRENSNAVNGMIAYHGSLDAAHRLHDALLLDRGCAMNLENGYAAVYGKGIDGKETGTVKGNLARAWLLAILNALKAKEPTP